MTRSVFVKGRRRRIVVDCTRHESDKAIRSTLLHEMCHAAVPGRGIAHGSAFWRELEMLLRKKAPIEVGAPEAPAEYWTLEPPAKFRLARRQFLKAHEREVRRQVRELERKGVHIGEDEHITMEDMEDIAERFEYAAEFHGAKWKGALFTILGENGLLDVDFKPSSTVQRYLPLFRNHYRRGLRKRRQHEAVEKKFGSAESIPRVSPDGVTIR